MPKGSRSWIPLLVLAWALTALGGELPSSPGWSLNRITAESEEPGDGSSESYYELHPPDGRSPIVVSASVAYSLGTGELDPEDAYRRQAGSGKSANKEPKGDVIRSTLVKDDGGTNGVEGMGAAAAQGEAPGALLKSLGSGGSGLAGLGGGIARTPASSYGSPVVAGTAGGSGNPGSMAGHGGSPGAAAGAAGPGEGSAPANPSSPADTGIKDDLPPPDSAEREIPTDNLSTTGKVPRPSGSVIWPPPPPPLPPPAPPPPPPLPPPASPPPPPLPPPESCKPGNKVYGFKGVAETFTVPSEVKLVRVEAWGGGGGGCGLYGGTAGGGGYVDCAVPVAPGQTYSVTVGAGGRSEGLNTNPQGNTCPLYNGGASSFSGAAGLCVP